jgi:hypothetical protein
MIFGLSDGDKKRAAELISATKLGDEKKIQKLLFIGANGDVVGPVSGDIALIVVVDNNG